MKNKSAVYLAIISWLCLSPLLFWNPWQEASPTLPAPPAPAVIQDHSILQQPSSIGTKENPNARRDYEFNMLRNPKTGRIPDGIRDKELVFAKKIPDSKSNGAAFRKAGILQSEWESAGPHNVGGRTRALALDLTNEEVIIAGGVSGGMWRSEDNGQSWQKTTPSRTNQSVTCLVQDPRPGKTNNWYYGTGELIGNSARGGDAPYLGDGIFKSTDGAKSWQLIPSTTRERPETFSTFFNYIFNIKVNPANLVEDELYAACVGGIFRSTDGGDSWEASLADTAALYTDLEVSSNGTFYATISAEKFEERFNLAGVYRSTDGSTWKNITPLGWPGDFGRTVIGMNPSNEHELYFLVQSEEGDRLWRYRDNAVASRRWEDLSGNLPDFEEETGELDLQGSYNMLVKVHPAEQNVVFLGGTNLYRSNDAFASSENIDWIGGYDTTGNFSPYPAHHPDQHELIFYPSSPARSISAHDGGLSFSSNILAPELSWTELNNGYKTSQFYTIGLDQTQVNDIIIGGLQDNGSQITNTAHPASSWKRILGGDGGYTHVASKGSYYYLSFQNSQIYRLTLNDAFETTSFARVDPPGAGQIQDQEYLFVNPFVFDPHNQNRMYLAAGNVVYLNRNLSQIPAGNQEPSSVNWNTLPTTAIDSGSISAISISTQPANILYYGTTIGDLFRLDSANSDSPRLREISSPLFPVGGFISHISVNPLNAEEILVTFSNYGVLSIFHSLDGGQRFTEVGGNLEENKDGSGSGPSVRFADFVQLQDGETLYLAGTSTGLYSSLGLNGRATRWMQEGPETIGHVVVPQMRYRSLDGRVVIATHGNGVFYRNIENIREIRNGEAVVSASLGNPMPNPTDGPVRIPYSLPEDGLARIRIYDILGRNIKTLLWSTQFAGTSEVSWDGTNSNGIPLPGGTYFVHLEYQKEVLGKRIVLVR